MAGHLRFRKMNLKVLSVVLGMMVLAVGAGESLGAPRKQSGPINVGMIALLASPQKYNQKVIQTVGFLNIGRVARVITSGFTKRTVNCSSARTRSRSICLMINGSSLPT